MGLTAFGGDSGRFTFGVMDVATVAQFQRVPNNGTEHVARLVTSYACNGNGLKARTATRPVI